MTDPVFRDLELTPADEPMLAALRARHGEPQRRYHDWSHVTALARAFADHRALFADGRAVALAILYHDAIYDPASATNEADSADLLVHERTGQEPAETLVLAEAMIRATAGHAVPDGLGPRATRDCAAFLDLDLSILAAPPEAYDAYVSGVRTEYAHVPDAAWRAGRTMVLSGFAERDRLFLTDALHEAWDGRARKNIARELDALGAA